MSLTNRFFIYAPFALFVILAVGVTIRWFSDAAAFSKRLDALNGHEAVPGVTLRFASKKIEGFPFRLDAVFKDFEVDIATPHGPSRWRAEDFALHRLTYGADKSLFEAAGRQSVSWTGLDGRQRILPFAVGSVQASVIEGDQGVRRFDLVVAAFASSALVAQDIQFHVRHDPAGDAIDVFVSADEVKLRARAPWPLGDALDHVVLSAKVTSGTTIEPLATGHASWTKVLAALQRAGGGFLVDQVEIARNRFDMTGKGQVALDGSARPQGTFDFKIAHLETVLGPARGHDGKGLARALLDRAAKGGSDDMGRLGIVIGAKDGVVYAGDEPVGMLTPLY